MTRSGVLSVFSRPGEDIRREISQDVILAGALTGPAMFTVTVTGGIVTIEGIPETAGAGRDIIDASRHAEGAVAVRGRLACPPAGHHGPGPLPRVR